MLSNHSFYGCETCSQLADTEKKIQAFETKYLKQLLRISYLEHKTNDQVRCKINSLVGQREPLLATVQRRKLPWFEHCHTPRQSLQNHSSGHLGGCETPWSAEETLDGQHQRVDIAAHARTTHNGLLHGRLQENLS